MAHYYARREEFIREFTARGEVPGVQLSPGTVQIGKAVYDFCGKTPEQVAAWLQPVIDEVACNVNMALFRVDLRRRLAVAPNLLDAERVPAAATADVAMAPPLALSNAAQV